MVNDWYKFMNIAVCLGLSFDDQGAYKYQGKQSRQFCEAYLSLNAGIIEKTGSPLHFVRINDFQEDGSFSRYYTLAGQVADSLRFEVVNERFMPDVVFNRLKDQLYQHPYFINAPWYAYNNQAVAKLGNKSVSLSHFSQYMPSSIYVSGAADVDKANNIIQERPEVAEWIVKPLRRCGGRGILRLDRSAVIDTIVADGQPLLLQEFCEARSVPELDIIGRHDVRVYVIDGEPLLLAVRQPKKGGFLANTAAGGSIRFLNIERLPAEAVAMISNIIDDINTIKKRYFISVDVFYTDNGWKLIEINDQPGMPALYQTPQSEVIVKKLVNSLKAICNT